MNPVALAIIIGYGAVLANRNEVQVGTVIAFTLLLTRLFEPIEQFIELTSLLQTAGAAFSRTFAFLAREPELVDEPGAADVRPGPGPHRAPRRHVPLQRRRAAGARRHRPRDRSRRAHRGGRHQRRRQVDAREADRALLRSHQGSIRIDGQDLRHVQSSSLRRDVVVVPQEGFLFDGTIAGNIALGRRGATRAEVEQACREIGFGDAIDKIPGGLDAKVANRGLTLSSGQRQLVALARAFLADPAVIVLDEATSNLDPATDALVERALGKLLAGRTAIVIAHRVPTARRRRASDRARARPHRRAGLARRVGRGRRRVRAVGPRVARVGHNGPMTEPPYWAVIFTSRRNEQPGDGYARGRRPHVRAGEPAARLPRLRHRRLRRPRHHGVVLGDGGGDRGVEGRRPSTSTRNAKAGPAGTSRTTSASPASSAPTRFSRPDAMSVAPPGPHQARRRPRAPAVLRVSDAAMVAHSVRESLEHLVPWMPWADEESTRESFQRQRLRGARHKAALGDEWQYGLLPERRIVARSARSG